MPDLCLATVIENKKLTNTVHLLTVDAGSIAEKAIPGQFVHIRCGEANLLRRPISICDSFGRKLTLVIEVHGEGTKWLASRQPKDVLDILGPLGNGFDTQGGHIVLVGGGVGVPPLLFTAQSTAGNTTAILGFRNKKAVILEEDFKGICDQVYVATEDGSAGEKGFVTRPLARVLEDGGVDAVLACGPKAMLKAVAEISARYNVSCQVSMEERMGCGIGACLVCACKTVKDGKDFMRHVCKDGPVFHAEEVCW